MILYELRCAAGHDFEVWFRSGAAFDALSAAGEVACPVCGGTDVRKAPMAPFVASRKGREAPPPAAPDPAGDTAKPAEPPAEATQAIAALRHLHETMVRVREHIESNCEYVGERFPEEARRIHYGETETRGIYGEASEQDAKALDDEGIEVHRLAWPDRRKSS